LGVEEVDVPLVLVPELLPATDELPETDGLPLETP
jgi:hypothetical protein